MRCGSHCSRRRTKRDRLAARTWQGDRSAALRCLHDYEIALERELDVAPSQFLLEIVKERAPWTLRHPLDLGVGKYVLDRADGLHLAPLVGAR
jgi:hypothetical protein